MYIGEFSDFLPLAVCTVNPIRIIININKGFEDLTGYKSIEIVGESIYIIFREKEEVEKILEGVQKKEKVAKELTLMTKEKEKIPVNTTISSRKDREGNFLGYFVGITDITELKKLQEEMEEKVKERTKELNEKLEELEKFRKLSVGRELKMVALKEEIKELKEELEKYKIKHGK